MAGPRIDLPDGTKGTQREADAMAKLAEIRGRGGSQSEIDAANTELGNASQEDFTQNGSGGLTNDDLNDAKSRIYNNPPAADVGGYAGGAKDIHDFFRAGEGNNDAAQASNDEAMGLSLDRMRQDRAPIAENAALVGREAGARGQQLQATDLARQAAMGQAPSAADAQTGMDMNNIMGGQAGAMGSARGLAGLNGTQGAGASMMGMQSSQAGLQGAQGRSQEVNSAMSGYGGLAGDVRSGDLGRVQQSDQNALAGQGINDDWKLGNAGLAASQGGLGVSMRQADDQYFGASQEPAQRQLGYDQEMNSIAAGQSSQEAAARRAKSQEGQDHARQLAGGAITAGLTVAGTMAGGPVGGAAGGAAGGMINSRINSR